MLDPVLCGCSPSCGKSSDRRSIERWILEGSPSCPVTSGPSTSTTLPQQNPEIRRRDPPRRERRPRGRHATPLVRGLARGGVLPPRRPSRRRRRTRTRARRADARVDRTSPRRLRRRGRRRRSRRGASKTRVRRDGDAQSARDGGEKRDGNDENNTPENDTAGHRLRNVSRETRFDGVQRVLLAAGAVEALLDLVRAADGGGRKYTLRDASAGSGSVRGSSPSRTRTATVTSAEGSSASRHARLASEDIDARGRPFDETRAVWSSVAVVAAMEALAELCAGSSAAKSESVERRAFRRGDHRRARGRARARPGMVAGRNERDARARRGEGSGETRGRGRGRVGIGGAESGGAESAAEPSRLETPARVPRPRSTILTCRRRTVSRRCSRRTRAATRSSRGSPPNGAFWLRRRRAARRRGGDDARDDVRSTRKRVVRGIRRRRERPHRDDRGVRRGVPRGVPGIGRRRGIGIGILRGFASFAFSRTRVAGARVRDGALESLRAPAQRRRGGETRRRGHSREGGDDVPRGRRGRFSPETVSRRRRDGDGDGDGDFSRGKRVSLFRFLFHVLRVFSDRFPSDRARAGVSRGRVRVFASRDARVSQPVPARNVGDPGGRSRLAGPTGAGVDPFPHLGDANTGGAVHTDYFAKQLVRLRRAVHEGRLDPADLASRRGAPVSCLASTLRGRRSPKRHERIRAQARVFAAAGKSSPRVRRANDARRRGERGERSGRSGRSGRRRERRRRKRRDANVNANADRGGAAVPVAVARGRLDSSRGAPTVEMPPARRGRIAGDDRSRSSRGTYASKTATRARRTTRRRRNRRRLAGGRGWRRMRDAGATLDAFARRRR